MIKTTQELPGYVVHDDKQIAGFFYPYRFLSNFYPAEVELQGFNFGSTEAAFQAAKCQSRDEMEIFTQMSASESKSEGKKVKKRDDWDNVRYDVMYCLVFQKFNRHEHLRKLLLNTGDRVLIESNSWNDNEWGQSFLQLKNKTWEKNGEGKNWLGKILMMTRLLLKTS
jgi:ribA/ribD-fused uncharacterized protein